jgi:hypothetical protein
MNLQLDLPTDFNTASSFVGLHRQLKTRLALSLVLLRLFLHTYTLQQPDETGKKAGEMA